MDDGSGHKRSPTQSVLMHTFSKWDSMALPTPGTLCMPVSKVDAMLFGCVNAYSSSNHLKLSGVWGVVIDAIAHP